MALEGIASPIFKHAGGDYLLRAFSTPVSVYRHRPHTSASRPRKGFIESRACRHGVAHPQQPDRAEGTTHTSYFHTTPPHFALTVS